MPHILLDNNTNRLLGEGLYTRDVTTGAKVFLDETATLEVTLIDHETGDEIVGETWPLALTHLTGSQGGFHAPLRAETLTLGPYQLVDAVVTGTDVSDMVLEVTLECIVQTRRK